MNPEKNPIYPQPIRIQDLTVTPKIGKLTEMIFGKIKANIPESQSHGIPEIEKQEKSDIIMVRKVTHQYKNRSRVNHATTFKNKPKMFIMDTEDTSKTNIGSDYISHIDPKNIQTKWNH